MCEFRGFFLDRKGVLDYNRIDIEWVSIETLPERTREAVLRIVREKGRIYPKTEYDFKVRLNKECSYYE